ncbi:MAG: hypothetical protein PHC28_01335 [Flavobacterium sp.]|uniref:hypothetical protein n=1 Tax=Flavobacterium sp. TaxID=239 RepID=UPI00260EB65F|nr:hypothetical protein [Flavobacterium sp.]MDD5149110.1 hypothetical protein [Flavobacterium sp.]
MGGLLTHLAIASFGAGIFWLILKRYYYGLAFFVGHLIPDLLDFGITAIIKKSLSPAVIMTSPYFRPLALFGHTFSNWLIIAVILLAIIFLLYKFKKISKSKFSAIIISVILVLSGIIVHLIIDKFVIERSYWI